MPQFSLKRNENKIKESIRSTLYLTLQYTWDYIPPFFYRDITIDTLLVALTRLCNINCVFCPYQYAKKEDLVHMQDNVFERVLEDIKNTGFKHVMLSPDLGEPMLAPNFIEKLRRMRENGIKLIDINTNGTYFHKIGFKELLTDGPDKMGISFPGFNKEMYARVTRNPNLYNQTRENILTLLRENVKMGRPKEICVSLRGDEEIETMKSYPEMEEVMELADDVQCMYEVDDWVGIIKRENLTGKLTLQKEKAPLKKRPCLKMFNIVVHPDGNLHLCSCRNINRHPQMQIGNIMEMTLKEARQKTSKKLRDWKNNDYPDLCKKCSMYVDPLYSIGGRFRRIYARRVLNKHYF